MKDVIIHAGLHRCASTAIQNMLETLRPRIEAAGTSLIVRADMKADWRLRQFRAIPRADTTGLTGWWRRTLGTSAIASGPRDRVLISEEALLGTMPGFRGHEFYPRQHLIWAALAARPALTVHPRLVVRRQDKWVESIYAFLVARGMASNFSEFVSDFDPAQMGYTPLLKTLDNHGLLDRTKIAVLEDWTRRDAFNCALGFFGLPDHPDEFRFQSHSRLPPHAIRLLVALNRSIGDVLSLKQQVPVNVALSRLDPDSSDAAIATTLETSLPGHLHDHIAKVLSTHDPLVPITFSNDERTRWRTALAEDNRQFLAHAAVEADTDVWNAD